MGDLMFNEFLDNVILMILCYAYILLVIFVWQEWSDLRALRQVRMFVQIENKGVCALAVSFVCSVGT